MMASVSPGVWASIAGGCTAGRSNPASSTPAAFSVPVEYAKCRRLGALAVARASQSESPERTPDEAVPDRVNLAFERAKAYQKEKPLPPPPPAIEESPREECGSFVGGGESGPEVADSVKLAMARAREYKKNRITPSPDANGAQEAVVSNIVEPAKEPSVASKTSNGTRKAVPVSVRLAVQRTREYKNSKLAIGDENDAKKQRNGLEKTKVGDSESEVIDNKVQKPDKLKVSSLDFVGLGFSERKNRGVPSGLVPIVDSFSGLALPEVEIIVGDTSKFDSSAPAELNLKEVEENTDVYKPKVSTWGVFPRPSNISKTYGGGRNIRPGEVLETAEMKAVKEQRTKQLIASYKRKIGLSIDAKTKAECEKALKDGDRLMDRGKLQEALPYFERVMKTLTFQSELHGMAALQWSICQDSLSRSNEARVMYEKLKSHPSVKVSKKAKQFIFGFQAMETIKASDYPLSKTTGYEDYFDAFVEDNVGYTPTGQDENALRQALPYVMLLISPVIIVLIVAIRRYF